MYELMKLLYEDISVQHIENDVDMSHGSNGLLLVC